MTVRRLKLRRAGTAWTITVPAAIAGTVPNLAVGSGRRATAAPYSSSAAFTCTVRSGGPDAVAELVYRPANASARRMLDDFLKGADR